MRPFTRCSALLLFCLIGPDSLAGADAASPGAPVAPVAPGAPAAPAAPHEAGSCSLEQALALAREHAPALLAASALNQAGEADRLTARAWINPVLEGSFGRGSARDGSAEGSESSLAIIQPFEAPSLRRARSAAGESAAALASADADSRIVESLAAARNGWFDALIDQEELRVVGEQESAALETAGLIARRVEAGESAGVEGLRSRVDLLRLQRLAGSLRARAESARARLTALTGGRLDPSCRLEGEATVPDPAGGLAEAAFAQVQENDPRVRLARSRVALAEADLALARRETLPVFDLGLFHDSEFDKTSSGASIGLSIPIWDRRRGPIARRTAELSLARSELAAAELELRSSFEAARREFLLASEQSREYATELLPRAEEAWGIARFSYEQGESSLIDLLDSGRIRLEIARESLEAARAFRSAETLLLTLTGGLR